MFINTHNRATKTLLLAAGKGETFHCRFDPKVYPLQSSARDPLAPVAAHD